MYFSSLQGQAVSFSPGWSQDQIQKDKQIRQINEDHLLIKEEPYQLVLNYREGFDLLAFKNRYQEYFKKVFFVDGVLDGLALHRYVVCVRQRVGDAFLGLHFGLIVRSEERRVGKECRSRWSPYH